jgi:hypothetical protein
VDKDIVAIAKGGGSPALDKVLEKLADLRKAGFADKDIVTIAAKNGGAQALDKVLATHAKLKEFGFADKDIVDIAAKNGGSQSLDKVLATHAKLKELGFAVKDIVAIAAKTGGSQALDKVLAMHDRFLAAGFTVQDMVAMSAHNGAAPALQAVSDHLAILQTRYSIKEIAKAGAKSRGAAGHVKQLADACRVKQEAASSSKRGPDTVLVEREIDQARTAFIPELPRCDLTTGQPIWSLDEGRATIVRHDMEPVPANNHKFPLRDLADPLGRVHARYAAEDGRCHPNVTLRKIDLAGGYKNYFKRLCRDPRVGLAPKAIAGVRTRLLENARQEFLRLLDNDRAGVEPQPLEQSASHWPCEPRRLGRNDVPAHEHKLAGQLGLFLKTPEAGQEQPVLGNGRILGFYTGVFAAGDDEIAAVEEAHPGFERYAIDAPRAGGKMTVYSAEGCANDLAFANTALVPDAPQPAYDKERLNAEFVPFELQLTDKAGKPARETVIAVVALDNAIDQELRIDYGPAFLQQFTRPAQAASRAPDAVVKTEANLDGAGPSSPRRSPRPRELDLDLNMPAAEAD